MSLKVEKKEGESSGSVTRRFTRAVHRSGILDRARGSKFFQRNVSDSKKKEKALRGIKIKEERERMKKLGKKLR